jgi:uncharacterized membrane-anchored protein YhcB (DUF1043 family)
VDSTLAIWLIASISLVAGVAIGFIGGRWYPGTDSRKALVDELEALRKQQQDYEKQVSSHFSRTAQLLGNLTLAYRDFHNHIADGAEDLSRDVNAAQIKPLPELPEDLISSKAMISQPLDYSPERNVLDEDYNFNKDHSVNEPPRY